MRGFLAFVSGLIAILLLAATVPTLWVSNNIVNESGYVTFSSVLATDNELQTAFADYLSNDLVRRGVLPASLEATVNSALTAVASRTTNEPGFVDVWERTQRSFHRSAFAPAATDPLTVDLAPLAAYVTERITGSLPVTLPVPDRLVVKVGDAQDRSSIDEINRSTDAGRAGLAATAIAALAAVALACRRAVAVMWLGAGTVIAAGALRVVTDRAAPGIIERMDAPSGFARTMHKLLADRVSDSFAVWLVWLAVAGIALLVVGLVGRVASGRASA